eukprot:2169728-Pleurochrysis_carterae.AAC.1
MAPFYLTKAAFTGRVNLREARGDSGLVQLVRDSEISEALFRDQHIVQGRLSKPSQQLSRLSRMTQILLQTTFGLQAAVGGGDQVARDIHIRGTPCLSDLVRA